MIYASYSLTESSLNYKDDEKKYASLNDMFVQDAKGNTGSDTQCFGRNPRILDFEETW